VTRAVVDCGKRRYSTKGYAKAALKTARKKGASVRTYYYHEACDGYHLSSYPPNRTRLRPLPQEES
jgi:hypothetical protein